MCGISESTSTSFELKCLERYSRTIECHAVDAQKIAHKITKKREKYEKSLPPSILEFIQYHLKQNPLEQIKIPEIEGIKTKLVKLLEDEKNAKFYAERLDRLAKEWFSEHK